MSNVNQQWSFDRSKRCLYYSIPDCINCQMQNDSNWTICDIGIEIVMIDKDLDPAGISTQRCLPYDNEDERYTFIQEHMLYELKGFLANKNEQEFLIAFVEYLMDERELYRKAAEDLLETQFVEYGEWIRGILGV